MTVVFLEEASLELQDAAQWYEESEPGLGVKFRNELEHVITRISQDPLLWAEQSHGYRRVNCPVFPYYVAYFIRGNEILIAAIAHGRRKPLYWKKRKTMHKVL
jgi:toxin ParE1/3/4